MTESRSFYHDLENLRAETASYHFDFAQIVSKQPILSNRYLEIISRWVFTESQKLFPWRVSLQQCAWTYLMICLSQEPVSSFLDLELLAWSSLYWSCQRHNLNLSIDSIVLALDSRYPYSKVYEVVKRAAELLSDKWEASLLIEIQMILIKDLHFSDRGKVLKQASLFSQEYYITPSKPTLLSAAFAALLWSFHSLKLDDLKAAFLSKYQDLCGAELESAEGLIQDLKESLEKK